MFLFMLLEMDVIPIPRAERDIWKTWISHLAGSNGKVASFIGRYYAMDRDKRWERIKEAYDLLVHGKGRAATDVLSGHAGIL